MMISNPWYVDVEVLVLSLIPVLMMLKLPRLFAKRHLLMAGAFGYVGWIAYELRFSFSRTVGTLPAIPTLVWQTLLPTAFILGLTYCLYLLKPQKITKMVRAVNFMEMPWYTPLILYPLVSVPMQEILFRWYAISRIQPYMANVWWTIVVSSMVFAIAHVPFGSKTMVMGTFILGLWWGEVYIATGSLWPSIISHILIGTYLLWLGLATPSKRVRLKFTA